MHSKVRTAGIIMCDIRIPRRSKAFHASTQSSPHPTAPKHLRYATQYNT